MNINDAIWKDLFLSFQRIIKLIVGIDRIHKIQVVAAQQVHGELLDWTLNPEPSTHFVESTNMSLNRATASGLHTDVWVGMW